VWVDFAILSNGLCNKQLAFGNWHDSANYIVTNPLKVEVASYFAVSKSATDVSAIFSGVFILVYAI